MRRTLGHLAILLLTLIVALNGINPPQAQAASLVLSPSSGTVGSGLTISGSGFSANETNINVTWDTSTIIASGLRADNSGVWTTTFVIPAAPSGSHNIAATGSLTPSTSTSYTIAPGLTLSQSTGAPGTSVTVTGTGFANAETGIAVTYDGNSLVPGISASSTGGWTATITIPPSSGGAHSVTAFGTTTSPAVVRTIAFTVTPTVTINKSSGAPGSSLTVSGAGFGANESGVTVNWDGAPAATGITAGSTGSWSSTITIPPSPAGSHTIHAYGATTTPSITPDVVFIVGAGIATEQTNGSPGTSVTVTGAGFGASETGITVNWDNTAVASGVRANVTGAWTASFTIPPAPAGAHTIRAAGSTTASVPDITFTVTAGVSSTMSSGSPGSSMTVTGTGFAASETGITVTYDGANVASSIRANAVGTWTATFLVPASASGAHAIHASGAVTPASATQDFIFNVVPGLALSQTAGVPGSTITITGTGFAPNETGISVTYDGASVASGIRANATGSWSTSVTVPASTSGPHNFHSAGSISLATATPDVAYTVNPGISVDQATGAAGSSVTVTGAGFSANEGGITVTYDNTNVASGVRANANGSFTATFTIPPSSAGSHTISAKGAVTQATAVSQISFGTTASLALSPASGFVGATVQVSGSGFAVNSALKVTYDDKDLTAQGATTDATGSFSISITIPVSKGGAHSVTVADAQKNQVKANFNMDNTAPAAPALNFPNDGGRVGFLGSSMPAFRWAAVTDPSGVSYQLQIDTNSDFSQPILDKTNIPANHYTLTASESLPLGEYYWRVKAIDQASNQSAWSEPRVVKSGVMSAVTLIILIALFLAAAAVAYYIIRVYLPKRRQRAVAVPEGAGPRVVVTGQWRSLEGPSTEEAPRDRPLPLRLALPQPEKGKKSLSNEDQARLKVIVDFAQSLPLSEAGYTTAWLLDLLESGSGIQPSAPIYEQILKGELQVRYEPAWLHHPTYQDLTSLLEGQAVLQDLNAFVDAVNRCAGEATALLQDIYRDTTAEIPSGLLEKGGWAFISGVYADATSWFLGKALRDPSERDYSIKPRDESGPEGGLWLQGEANTTFAGPLIQSSDEKEALRYRGLHLKLRRAYRNNNKAKDFVSMMTQLDVQRSRLLNVFSQFGRLKQ